MFGSNPIRGIEKGFGDELFVQDIFLTIQGEGPLVGHPAVFVRLGGCNLACTFCDTEFESFTQVSIDKILEKILSFKTNLVVITGGEPMRQPMEKFCDLLLKNNLKVQIETNGTIYRNLPDSVSIVCSPKAPRGKYYKLREDVLKRINALKFLISKNHKAYGSVPDVGQKGYNIPIYVQPMDEYDEELNNQNTQHAISLVQKFGYILSLQIHKFVGIP